MSEVTGPNGARHTVWIFNPGSNKNQVSRLRVINNGQGTAAVRVSGIDDAGNAGPGSDLTFNLPFRSVQKMLRLKSLRNWLIVRVIESDGTH